MSKVRQKYKGEKKRLKLTLAETIAPGQGTDLLTLLFSSELDGEDDNDEMDEMVKMYQARDSLNRFSFFSIHFRLLPAYRLRIVCSLTYRLF